MKIQREPVADRSRGGGFDGELRLYRLKHRRNISVRFSYEREIITVSYKTAVFIPACKIVPHAGISIKRNIVALCVFCRLTCRTVALDIDGYGDLCFLIIGNIFV